ncbi:MAG: FAD-dependent oxidoreductase [Firmicutes bacterium]|nr:FAD-dependent oxidoreductase [Bacillota bacterium]
MKKSLAEKVFALLSDPACKMDRRQILSAMLMGAGVLSSLSFLLGGKAEASVKPQGTAEKTFGGDTYKLCHPPLKDIVNPPKAHYEVIIAGGGISGLTAAYKLRDKKLLVIEKEKKPGGYAKRDKWQNIYFAEGSAYLSAPSQTIKKFYDEIKLPLKEIKPPVDCLWTNGRFIDDFWGENIVELPFDNDVKDGFKAARDEFLSYQEEKYPPTVPVEESPEQFLKLDTRLFSDYLKKYPATVAGFVSNFCRDCWGVGAEELSVFSGINFFASFFDRTYTFPGGNGGFTDCIMGYLDGVVKTGSTITGIRRESGKVVVEYLDEEGVHTSVTCDSLIFAMPKLVANRLIKDLPEQKKEIFSKFRYASYMVADVMFQEKIFGKSYSTWFQNKVFTDMIAADYIEGSKSPAGQVLTFYMPMGEKEGRMKLLKDSFSKWERTLRQDIENIFPGINDKIVDVRLYRYGHPNVISFPGLVTKICPEARKPDKGIYFAHSDSEGLPCVESAVWMGIKSARELNERNI